MIVENGGSMAEQAARPLFLNGLCYKPLPCRNSHLSAFPAVEPAALRRGMISQFGIDFPSAHQLTERGDFQGGLYHRFPQSHL